MANDRRFATLHYGTGAARARKRRNPNVPYYRLDSFTGELFTGNPAGVWIFSAFPVDSVMQKIAAENRHSETAFLVSREDGVFELRWFTSHVETDLCGPATVVQSSNAHWPAIG